MSKRRLAIYALIGVLTLGSVGCGIVERTETAGDALIENSQDTTSANEVAAELTAEHEITSKDVKLNWYKFEEPFDTTVYFIDGITEIPYFEIEDFVTIKNLMTDIEKRDSVIEECRKEGNQVILVRDNGSECIMDFEQSTIHFDNFDKFVQCGFSDALVSDVWRHETFEDGSPKYFTNARESVNRSGYPVTLSLADYDIQMICQDSKYFVPVQTMSDILLNEMTDFIAYNGSNLYIYDDGLNSSPYAMEFYSVPKGKRSEELATFTYNELAFVLDFNYGQKEAQNITDFRSYLRAIGLEEPLLSSEPLESHKALDTLTNQFLGGRHNFTVSYTYLADPSDEYLDEIRVIKAANEKVEFNLTSTYMNAREQIYKGGDAVPCYEEVGDTAILTFKGFEFAPDDVDYYEATVSGDKLGDCYHGINTIGLIQYAHAQITRPDSPIENVVIDLSNNAGGDVDAGIFFLAWIMGEAPVSLRDTATGAETTAYYMCDANFDGVFDKQDNLTDCGKKVYCLVSPCTFSCANFVPSVLKETQSAVILGRTSGGGTCSVMPLCTADGTVIGISGRDEICTVRNGSYYDVDKGVTPDFTFTNLESFYDRERLVDIIHNLY